MRTGYARYRRNTRNLLVCMIRLSVISSLYVPCYLNKVTWFDLIRINQSEYVFSPKIHAQYIGLDFVDWLKGELYNTTVPVVASDASKYRVHQRTKRLCLALQSPSRKPYATAKVAINGKLFHCCSRRWPFHIRLYKWILSTQQVENERIETSVSDTINAYNHYVVD